MHPLCENRFLCPGGMGLYIIPETSFKLQGQKQNPYNLHFKRMTPITMKRFLPSGPLKTKLIIK